MGFDFGRALLAAGTLGGSEALGMFGEGGGGGQLGEVKGIYGRAMTAQAFGNAQALASYRRALPAIRKGYGNARRDLSMGQAGAYQTARDQGQQLGSEIDQRMQERGLYNSTIYDNARAGISGDLTRRLAEIDTLFSGAFSDLSRGLGEAEAGLYTGEAGLIQGQTGETVGLYKDYANMLAGVEHEDPNAWLDSLLGSATTIGAAALIGSDPRLKQNVQRVGTSPSGVPIYEFEYRAEPGNVYRGVMSTDVPHAVRKIAGFDYVDYSKLDVAFERVT